MDDIQANDQVLFRKRIRTGILIRMGSVVRVDGDNAMVNFPIDHSSAVIPMAQLEKTSNRFGQNYNRVQVDPVRRRIL